MIKNKINENDENTYVTCRVCNKKLVRVDGNHIAMHGLNTASYDVRFNTTKEDRIAKTIINKLKFTKDISIEKYGLEEGMKRWNEYRLKQSLKNTFEYKHHKYGWTREQFDEYNRGRACTRDNFIRRYGDEKGCAKWDEYIKLQKYVGCSIEYFKDKLGEIEGQQRYDAVCRSKINNLYNYIKKYGEEKGIDRYKHYIEKKASKSFHSKISQDLFWKIHNNTNNQYFAQKNKEFCIYDNVKCRPFFYDFVDTTSKKCVEFNGDIFHANPLIYKAEDTPNFYNKNISAYDIWEHDNYKIKILESLGYSVIIIWESEYINDPEGCVSRAKKFIYE